MAEQPNFHIISDSFRTVADQIRLVANLPAIEDRQLSRRRHEELVELIRGVHTRLDQLSVTIAANDNNSVARSLNASITRGTTRLHPLKPQANEEVEGFPETLDALNIQTSPQINHLLREFNLSLVGNINDRRHRFRQFCGVGWGG